MKWNKAKYIGLAIASEIALVPATWFLTADRLRADAAADHMPNAFLTGAVIGMLLAAPVFGLAWAATAEFVVAQMRRTPVAMLAILASWVVVFLLINLSLAPVVIAIYLVAGMIIVGVWHLLLMIGLAPKLPIEADPMLQHVFE